jgi:hypothetical protein
MAYYRHSPKSSLSKLGYFPVFTILVIFIQGVVSNYSILVPIKFYSPLSSQYFFFSFLRVFNAYSGMHELRVSTSLKGTSKSSISAAHLVNSIINSHG